MIPLPKGDRMCSRCRMFQEMEEGVSTCSECNQVLMNEYAKIDRVRDAANRRNDLQAEEAKGYAYKVWLNFHPLDENGRVSL